MTDNGNFREEEHHQEPLIKQEDQEEEVGNQKEEYKFEIFEKDELEEEKNREEIVLDEILEKDEKGGLDQAEDEEEVNEVEKRQGQEYQFIEGDESLTSQKSEEIASVSERRRDLYHIPAILDKALVYRKTTIPGIPEPSLPRCKSNNQLQRTPYSLFCSQRNKEAPNEVISLYLQNTIFCIILLSIIFLSQLYVLITNRKYACKYKYPKSSGKCPWSDLEVNFLTLSKINKMITNPEDQKAYQEALVFGLWLKLGIHLSLFILPILFIYLEERERAGIRAKLTSAAINKENLDVSDYSIMIHSKAEEINQRLNIDGLRVYLKEILEETDSKDPEESRTEDLKILDYFISTKLTPYLFLEIQAKQLTQQIDFTTKLQEDHRGDENNPKFDQKEEKKLALIIKKFQNNLKKLAKKLRKKSRFLKKFKKDPFPQSPMNERILGPYSVVFITFSSTETRNKILRAKRIITSKLKLSFRKPKNPQHNFLKIEPAPKIDKIIWKNCAISEKERATYQYSGNFAAYVCFMFVLWVVSKITKWMTEQIFDDNSQDPTKKGSVDEDVRAQYPFLVFSVMIIFKICNFLIQKLGTFSDGIVKNSFDFTTLIALGCLKSYSLFFTFQKIMLKNEEYDLEEILKKLLHVLFLDALLQIVTKLISLSLVWKNLKIFYFSYRSKNLKKKLMVSQGELNSSFEPPASPIGSLLCLKFSVIYSSIALCETYTWLLLLVYILYLVISYFVDRFLLLRVYAEPNPEDAKIFVEIRKCFFLFTPFSLIISWLGEFLGSKDLSPELGRFSFIYLIVAGASWVLAIVFYFVYLFFGSFFDLKLEAEAMTRKGEDQKYQESGEDGVVEAGSLVASDASLEQSLNGLGDADDGGDTVGVGCFDELYGQIFRNKE